MLLQAYAFGTLGVIAGYAAIASLLGALLFLILGIAAINSPSSLPVKRCDDLTLNSP